LQRTGDVSVIFLAGAYRLVLPCELISLVPRYDLTQNENWQLAVFFGFNGWPVWRQSKDNLVNNLASAEALRQASERMGGRGECNQVGNVAVTSAPLEARPPAFRAHDARLISQRSPSRKFLCLCEISDNRICITSEFARISDMSHAND
jgi:hypothetical protein